MNAADARTALRWALTNPNKAEAVGKPLWSEVQELIPQMLGTAGTFLISELLARRFGAKVPTRPVMQPLNLEQLQAIGESPNGA